MYPYLALLQEDLNDLISPNYFGPDEVIVRAAIDEVISLFSAGLAWGHAPITDASASGRALAVGAAATDRGPGHESHDAGSGPARSQERVESNGAETSGGEAFREFLFVLVCGRSM